MQRLNTKLALLSYIQKRQSVTLNELHQFASERLKIKDKKYLYSAYLYSLLKQGHIVRQRRGLYSIVDIDQPSIPPDPYILASRLRHPYYLGYTSALDLLGAASSLFTQIIVAVRKGDRFSSFEYPQGNPRYRILSTEADDLKQGLRQVTYQGDDLIISSEARTLIEVVDQPQLAGGWGEVIRSLDLLITNFRLNDLEEVGILLELFGNKSLAARVGFLLDMFATMGSLSLPLDTLDRVRSWVTNGSPSYLFSRSSLEEVVRNKKWNIYVPKDFLERFFVDQRIGQFS